MVRALAALLLVAAAPADTPGFDGESPLWRAIAAGDAPLVDVWLEAGADPSIADPDGWTALHEAAADGQVAVVAALVRWGARLDARDAHGWTALMAAEWYGIDDERGDVPLLLRAAGASEEGLLEVALWRAAEAGDARRVRELLSRGVSPDARASAGEAALHLAARGGHASVAAALLAAGADPDALDDQGWTPWMIARHQGHRDVAERLESAGAAVPADSCTDVARLDLRNGVFPGGALRLEGGRTRTRDPLDPAREGPYIAIANDRVLEPAPGTAIRLVELAERGGRGDRRRVVALRCAGGRLAVVLDRTERALRTEAAGGELRLVWPEWAPGEPQCCPGREREAHHAWDAVAGAFVPSD